MIQLQVKVDMSKLTELFNLVKPEKRKQFMAMILDRVGQEVQDHEKKTMKSSLVLKRESWNLNAVGFVRAQKTDAIPRSRVFIKEKSWYLGQQITGGKRVPLNGFSFPGPGGMATDAQFDVAIPIQARTSKSKSIPKRLMPSSLVKYQKAFVITVREKKYLVSAKKKRTRNAEGKMRHLGNLTFWYLLAPYSQLKPSFPFYKAGNVYIDTHYKRIAEETFEKYRKSLAREL